MALAVQMNSFFSSLPHFNSLVRVTWTERVAMCDMSGLVQRLLRPTLAKDRKLCAKADGGV